MPHRFEPWGDFVDRLEGPERAAVIPAGAIVGRMGLGGGDVVVDLGSGTGYFSIPIASVAKSVVSVDIAPEMLRYVSGRLRERGTRNVHIVRGDVLSPPVADASADHVLAAFIYHEVDSPRRLLDECARVLVPAGRLTVVDFQKWDTGFGPPVSERKTPEQVLRTAKKSFDLLLREETDTYYQLVLAKR